MLGSRVLVLAGLLASACLAADVSFTAGPSAARDGDKVKISFAVSAPTDVEVAVLDGEGKVVRHLAAGAVGQSGAAAPLAAPLAALLAAPLGPGLAQELIWDGADDAGRPAMAAGAGAAGGGPFTVRVRCGQVFRFDKALGFNPLNIGGVLGLAVDGKGQLFVLHASDYAARSSPSMMVLGRDGKYLRTLMPWPANPPADRVKDVWVQAGPGQWIPRVTHAFQCLYPQTAIMFGQTMCVAGEDLVFVNAFGDIGTRILPRLLRLNAADGLPGGGGFEGPLLQAEAMAAVEVHLAASPDGKTIYAAGLIGPGQWKREPQNVVLAVGRDAKGPARPLIGEPYKAGKDETHLNNPMGLAVDGDGRIYVADRDNNRVAAFAADGKFVGALAVPAPVVVAVHPKKGTIYVVTQPDKTGNGNRLLRFASLKGEQTGELALPAKPLRPRLAVDASADPAGIWFAHANSDAESGELWRVADEPAMSRTIVARTGGDGLPRPMYLAADRLTGRDEVYVRDWSREKTLRFSPAADAPQVMPFDVADLAVGPDGSIYGYSGGYSVKGKVARFDHDGKPLPFGGGAEGSAEGSASTAPGSAGGVDAITFAGTLRGGHMRGCRGLAVAPNGDLYVLRFKGFQDKDKGWDAVVLDVYGADGAARRTDVVTLTSGGGGVRVDGQGNIYVVEHVLPIDNKALDPFKALPPAALLPYRQVYGSILKFGPGGGQAAFSSRPFPAGEQGTPGVGTSWDASGGVGHFRIKGDLRAIFAGISPAAQGPKGAGCTCFTPRFDLDEFGRLFVPDAARFSVRVLDSAGNELARFGSYGNADAPAALPAGQAAGAGAPNRGPQRLGSPAGAISFAWPAYVAATDQAVYVSDMLNRRLVRVKRSWQAKQTCPVK